MFFQLVNRFFGIDDYAALRYVSMIYAYTCAYVCLCGYID